MADGLPPRPDTGAEEPPPQRPAPSIERPSLDSIRVKAPGARGLNKPAILTAAGGGVARIGRALATCCDLRLLERLEVLHGHVDLAADLDAAIKDRLVTDVAAKLDTQLFGATGDGITTPQGLFAWAGTQSLAVGGPIELDDLHDAEALALGENVDPANLRWVMRSRELIALRKIKATDGNYIVQPDVTAAGGYTLLGHPVIVSNRIPDAAGTPNTGRAALVDFSQVAVARDMAPTVKILDQTFGDYDQMAIRIVCRYDAKPLNPEAVIKLTGITL